MYVGAIGGRDSPLDDVQLPERGRRSIVWRRLFAANQLAPPPPPPSPRFDSVWLLSAAVVCFVGSASRWTGDSLEAVGNSGASLFFFF